LSIDELIEDRPGWINPVEGPVTSLFGMRTNPVTMQSEFHNGLDIAVAEGTPVLSVRDATVYHVGYTALNGIYMRLRCNTDGYQFVFAHLSEAIASEGDKVYQGQKVALSGNTGQSTGPHLHYGISRDGYRLDPLARVDLQLSYHAATEYASR